MSSPSQRSLDYLKGKDYVVDKVERYNPYSRKYSDLFGLFDYLYIADGVLYGLQVTSGSNHAAHRIKLQNNPILNLWLETGCGAVIHSWSKKVKRNKDGKKSKVRRWQLRTEYL